jgi:outer membrane protein TolC
MRRAAPTAIVWLLIATVAGGQTQSVAARLELADLYRAAETADPRIRELPLLERQWTLRNMNVNVLRLPSVTAEGLSQVQSDAPSAPIPGPSGRPLFSAPKTTVDALLRVEQRLFDPTVNAQAALLRAQLAEDQSRVRTAVYGVRQQVNDAFFAAAALEQRAGVLAASATELEARLRETTARVREGTALPADAAVVEATLLQQRQEEDELRTNRRAALDRLATIVGRAIDPDATLILPDLAMVARGAVAKLPDLRTRPEFAQFARTRERLARQRDLTTAQTQPKITAFGRVGYGRPGLNFIRDDFEPYGVGGVRLQWNAWSWGAPRREAEATSLQGDIVSAEEAALARSIVESTRGDVATIDRLERAIDVDRRIVELRAEVERSARARMNEGVMTAADYLARDTELLQARFAQAGHVVELAQARARVLTMVGVEVP